MMSWISSQRFGKLSKRIDSSALSQLFVCVFPDNSKISGATENIENPAEGDTGRTKNRESTLESSWKAQKILKRRPNPPRSVFRHKSDERLRRGRSPRVRFFTTNGLCFFGETLMLPTPCPNSNPKGDTRHPPVF